ncbi:Malate/lactate/ureidoglycolate dehydrogenase, LDH2 family [Cyclobacterium lianum]|uniref:Malate/lactate/ureidoglycolate dehydrogenase, LDH2 family n=1 Tax=Cyclobacterium lianum TaxID=388280 RepID=A0A1M7KCG6_9BACT|nr:Ldh family oxidoreductase [Cyclobacterium lianum]SHM62928.1 Malate/lactate/ureidoglycolate dehydrogenase, LDH2 family [Cyclobacterium lianum]
MEENVRYDPKALRVFMERVFLHFGIPENDARLATDVLAYSDEHGIDSHGIARLKTYYGLLRAGRINPKPRVKLIREKHAVVQVDGDNGLGLVVGPKCMDIAIEKAGNYGSGSVAVCHTNHFGAAGYYPLMAVKHDFIGMAMTNTSKGVAPFLGKERMLGTNPVAMAFPADKEPTVLMDFASSTVAYGKVEIARRAGKKIPEGWCLDANGDATTAPEKMINGGALLPLGSSREGSGHKGYCLAGMVDILSAVLSGANWGPFAIPFAIDTVGGGRQVGKGIGHFFSAWDVDGFREVGEFKQEMDQWVKTLRASIPLPGEAEVLIPGDPEWRSYRERTKSGIPLQGEVVADLKAIAQETGIAMPHRTS